MARRASARSSLARYASVASTAGGVSPGRRRAPAGAPKGAVARLPRSAWVCLAQLAHDQVADAVQDQRNERNRNQQGFLRHLRGRRDCAAGQAALQRAVQVRDGTRWLGRATRCVSVAPVVKGAPRTRRGAAPAPCRDGNLNGLLDLPIEHMGEVLPRSACSMHTKDGGGRDREPNRTSVLGRGATVGRYLVVGLVGTGGMGEVYAAYDPELDRKIALKLLRTQSSVVADASEGRARLLREAQAIARLSDANVVTVYDVGTFENRVFLAMEFVDGNTLAYWLEAKDRSWREIVAVFAAAGRGLAAAHAPEWSTATSSPTM